MGAHKQQSVLPGYEGRYRVSDIGVVQSCCSKSGPRRIVEWWDMALGKDTNGYPLVYLWSRKAGRVRRLVHQLVAEAFIPKVAGKDCVNHLNGVVSDNRVENLEWCTRQENMQHAWRTGLCKPQKLTPDLVREILSCGGLDTEVAKRFGVSQVLVTKIRARKIWKSVA